MWQNKYPMDKPKPLLFFKEKIMEIKELENQIINADCMDTLKELPDKCIDAIICDFCA